MIGYYETVAIGMVCFTAVCVAIIYWGAAQLEGGVK